jgi:hypothetical protein
MDGLMRPRYKALDLEEGSQGIDRALEIALVLLRRSLIVGLLLFILPPTSELPYRWQAAIAFMVLVAWCYIYGAFARRNIQIAALEAIPTLWLSLKCTEIMILLVGLV